MMQLSLLAVLICNFILADGCTDTMSERNSLDVSDTDNNFLERLTSCDRLIGCYPGLCDNRGFSKGLCCESCKKVGAQNCMNRASPCSPLFVYPSGDPKEKQSIFSCNTIVSDFVDMCDKDSFGGKGNSCCKACKEAPNPANPIRCVDSTTWKLGTGKKAKTCDQLATKARKMKSCCKKDKKGQGTSLRCRAACCASCAKLA